MAIIIEDEVICKVEDKTYLSIIKFGKEAYVSFRGKPIGKVWIFTDSVEQDLEERKYIIINSIVTYI